MALNYKNLDQQTRKYMLEEINSDISSGKLYISTRLNPDGVRAWPKLIAEASSSHNDDWLAAQILNRNLLNTHYERHTKKGISMVKMPINAHDTMAEGEFNRFYARGLCARALAEGIKSVKVYRARYSENPRPESEALVGKELDPAIFLIDLRVHIGIEPALGLPLPNSGLSICLKC